MDSDEEETTDRSNYSFAYDAYARAPPGTRPMQLACRPARLRHFAAASTGTSMFSPTYFTRLSSVYIPPAPPSASSSSSQAPDNATTNESDEQEECPEIDGNDELLNGSTKSSSPELGDDLGIETVSNDGVDAAALVDCLPNMPSLLDANEEENVRSPIPPRRDVLQLPEDDNFRTRKRRMPPHSQQLVYRNFQQEGEMQELQHEKILDHHREHFDMELQIRHRSAPKRHRSADSQISDGNLINSRNAGGIDNFTVGNLSGTNNANNESNAGKGKTTSLSGGGGGGGGSGSGDTTSTSNIITNALETEGIPTGSDNVTSARTHGQNIVGIRKFNVGTPHGFGYSINNSSNTFRGSMYPLVRRSYTNERRDGVYRPPTHACTLNEARDFATAKNRWLLVNYLNSDDVRSHRLTTDLYSTDLTKLITSRFFYIHTIYTNTAEGLRLQSFYSIKQAPYICILDPRTGEELYANRNAFFLQNMEYYTALKTFICNHTMYPNMDGLTAEEKAEDLEEILPDVFKSIRKTPITATPLSTTTTTLTTPTSSLTTAPTSAVTKPTAIPEVVEEILDSDDSTNDEPFPNKIDMSEDEQIRQAILDSLADKNVDKQSLSNDESSEQTQTDSSNSGDGVTNKKKNKCDKNTRKKSQNNVFDLTQSNEDSDDSNTDEPIPNNIDNGLDPLTHIQIRLTDGTKHILTWPCTTKLLMLRKFLQNLVKQKTFKLLKPFPRTDVLQMDNSMTLSDAGLHPNVILTLHTDD